MENPWNFVRESFTAIHPPPRGCERAGFSGCSRVGFKKYRGPIETVEHAMMAHMVVTVTCAVCGHSRGMWAWRIYEARRETAARMPLRKPLPGFWCRDCRRPVEVTITPGMQ